jgi:hypothetical protein
LPPLSELKKSLAKARQEIALSPQELETPTKVPAGALAEVKPEIPKNGELQKVTAPAAPRIAAPRSRKPRQLSAARIAAEWVPPAILIAWKRLDAKQKQLVTHVGAVSIGLAMGLLVILTVTHIHGSADRPPQAIFQQRDAASPASFDGPSGNSVEFQKQGPPMTAAILPSNQPKPPESSILSKIAHRLFGIGSDGPPQINDYQMGLAVWTSQSTGYYYCSDDPYVKSVDSGVPMLQGDALQAGYRPRLGQFCN